MWNKPIHYNEEIDNLYKIIHQTSNFKIKIQTLLFIFQFLNAEKALSDRYYRVLYELVKNITLYIYILLINITLYRYYLKKYGIVL